MLVVHICKGSVIANHFEVFTKWLQQRTVTFHEWQKPNIVVFFNKILLSTVETFGVHWVTSYVSVP